MFWSWVWLITKTRLPDNAHYLPAANDGNGTVFGSLSILRIGNRDVQGLLSISVIVFCSVWSHSEVLFHRGFLSILQLAFVAWATPHMSHIRRCRLALPKPHPLSCSELIEMAKQKIIFDNAKSNYRTEIDARSKFQVNALTMTWKLVGNCCMSAWRSRRSRKPESSIFIVIGDEFYSYFLAVVFCTIIKITAENRFKIAIDGVMMK